MSLCVFIPFGLEVVLVFACSFGDFTCQYDDDDDDDYADCYEWIKRDTYER